MKMLDHRRAGARRTNYRVGVRLLEDLDKAFGEFLCFLSVTGIERRLAAAGLPFVKDNLASDTTQNLDRAYAYVRA